MQYIHAIVLISAIAGAAIQASSATEGFDSAAVVQRVTQALPQGVQISPPNSGYTRNRGHLGNTPHFYINLVDTSIKYLRINNRADAYLIFISGVSRHPNERIYKKYHSSLVATNSKFRVYLLAPDSQRGIWQKCREELKEAFFPQNHSTTNGHINPFPLLSAERSETNQFDRVEGAVLLQELLHPSLNSIIIPQVDFLQANLHDVITFLNRASSEFVSPPQQSLIIYLANGVSNDKNQVSLTMNNVSLRVILDNVAKQTGLSYKVFNGKVILAKEFGVNKKVATEICKE